MLPPPVDRNCLSYSSADVEATVNGCTRRGDAPCPRVPSGEPRGRPDTLARIPCHRSRGARSVSCWRSTAVNRALRAATMGVLLLSPVALSACSAGQVTQTASQERDKVGAMAQVGDLTIRAVQLVSPGEDGYE